jgi:hypothetical protein
MLWHEHNDIEHDHKTSPTFTIVKAMKRRKKNDCLGRKYDKYGFPSDRRQAPE